MAELKARERAAVRAARAARPADERASAAAAIAHHALSLLPAEPALVCAYVSLPTEPGTDPLVAAAQAAGHRLLVPRIAGRDLEWVMLGPDTALSLGPLGIRQPLGTARNSRDLHEVDVMLLPGLAVDREGRRLGQGGGYYDRVLAALPSRVEGGPLLAIVLFDEEVRGDVPHEPHDVPVDAAVTPSGVLWLRGAAGTV